VPRNFIGPINKFKFLPWLSPYAAELDSAIGTSFPGLFRQIDAVDQKATTTDRRAATLDG
jgi:hypothetical protein